MAIGAEPAREQLPAPSVGDGDFLRLGVEEEFHVVDLASRELVAQAPEILEQLRRIDLLRRAAPQRGGEQHRRSATTLDRAARGARRVPAAARRRPPRARGLGVVAAGTVPLVDPLRLAVTPTSRYERMLDDYQLLVREQLICGAQVHVAGRRPGPRRGHRPAGHARTLPVLLALSASSPFWMGEDTGYASIRSLVWQRWPTAGPAGEISTAAEHDALVADLSPPARSATPG